MSSSSSSPSPPPSPRSLSGVEVTTDSPSLSGENEMKDKDIELHPLTHSTALSSSPIVDVYVEGEVDDSDSDSKRTSTATLTSPTNSLRSPLISLLPKVSSAPTVLRSLNSNLMTMMMESSAETGNDDEVEMMDYDNPEDHLNERWLQESNASSSSSLARIKLAVLRVVITMFVGIAIGLVGYFVSRSVSSLIHASVSVLSSLMNADRPAAAFFGTLIISVSFTFLSALLVTFGSWQTRGSGVGRLNAYLSGMYSARFLTLRTLVCKVFGLILNVSAGIKQGMEGPFIHIGAMVGLHVSRLCIAIFTFFGNHFFPDLDKYTTIVSGIADERMFITAGAAAGFSVAFNAPIAGVLYVQDGAFAYWSGEYTFRSFLCTMTAVTTLNFCFIYQQDVLPSRGLIDAETQQSTNITIEEFWGFILLGIIGGVLGAAYTKLNVFCERLRSHYLSKKRLPNLLDVVCCTLGTIVLSFVLPFLFSCSPITPSCALNPDRCLQFFCGPSGFSNLATFFFELPEMTIRILFDRDMETEIGVGVLVIFCMFYFLMSALSYGMAVPGGLFIPSIIIGAAYGRLVGIGVASVLPPTLTATGELSHVNPGVYAVLGSASMLGGMTRMTLPITVMMIEVTSDAQFLIPIMLCVVLSKVIADRLVGGLYSEHLKLDGLLMVFGDTMPHQLSKFTAKDLMSKGELKQMKIIESVQSAHSMLTSTRHNAFPVVDNDLITMRDIAISEMKSNIDSRIGSSSVAMSDWKEDTELVESVDPSLHPGTRGSFIGLIQRRNLIYLLTSMPCYESFEQARDSEPSTSHITEHELEAFMQAAFLKSRMRLAKRTAKVGDRDEKTGALLRGGMNGEEEDRIHMEMKSMTANILSFPPNAHSNIPNPQRVLNLSASGVPSSNLSKRNNGTFASPKTAKKKSNTADPEPSASPPSQSTSLTAQRPSAVGVESSMMNHFVNLASFMDRGAYVVAESTSARRVWSLFRSMGMRHIVVVDHQHKPVGIITKKDLIRATQD